MGLVTPAPSSSPAPVSKATARWAAMLMRGYEKLGHRKHVSGAKGEIGMRMLAYVSLETCPPEVVEEVKRRLDKGEKVTKTVVREIEALAPAATVVRRQAAEGF